MGNILSANKHKNHCGTFYPECTPQDAQRISFSEFSEGVKQEDERSAV